MEIHSFVLGGYGVSAYVVTAGERNVPPGAVMIVDAPEGAEALIAHCDARGLVPKMLVDTHGHADHIYCNKMLKERWPAMQIAVGAADAKLLASPLRNLSALMGAWVKSPPPDRLLADGDRVELGSASFEVLATPGHTKGGISLFSTDGPDGRPVVFTGDTLFAGGIGRTDFPGGSHETLLESIRGRLLALPPETLVYPGHGPASTIGEEARTNPFL
ncbi:MAG: MBL fold metallo-hydrolase [Phycisphaerae bacterium]|nr:MBL fold metallo-hydrolase [Phycisphaerae bacterium]